MPGRPASHQLRALVSALRRLAPELIFALPLLPILAYSWMPAGVSVPNERSRVYLSVAMVDSHSVSIDGPVYRFGNIYDIAMRDNRLYSDKAPGTSLLGALVYWGHRVSSQASAWQIHQLLNLMRTWVMLPVGLFGFLLLRRLLFDLGHTRTAVDMASLAWILGSSAFHTSTAFMGHQIAAVSFLVLILCLRRAEHTRRAPLGTCLVAGLAAGFALLTEYQSGIVLLAFATYGLWGPLRGQPRALFALVAGAAPGIVTLLVYNTLAFGGPLELSYHHLVDQSLQRIHGAGVGGVSHPTAAWAFGGLLSLHRGFFATSPFFILVFPGLWWLARWKGRRLALAAGACLLGYGLFISSTEMWYAGWGFGPRLMVPVMGIAALLVATAIKHLQFRPVAMGACLGLVVTAVVYHQLVHAVFPEMPDHQRNPLLDVVIPALRGDVVVPNLGERIFGLAGRASVAPLGVLVGGYLLWITRAALRPLSWTERLLAITSAMVCLVTMAWIIRQQGHTDVVGSLKIVDWMRHLWIVEQTLPR